MKKTFIISALLLSIACLGNQAFAQESKFKALFIYKFAEYVQWPTSPTVLTVGIVGTSDVKEKLASFAETKGGLEVISIKSASDAAKCHMLYVPESEEKNLSLYTSFINKKSILLVSDNSSKVGKGADIGFYLEDGKLRFKIDKNNIESKKMIPSSKLLALGQSIN
ncbi:YfiR family protein [Reichenbachiella agarivorans]|uniref:YfiR family protein n=1 Tax=Reichenbachiella agarivorans TaxID=2979464 RepID=A0ABY6CN67_9BACT|nr:YfiR family protein [Reichenbachiella agarivorans]UXP30793.1 YfiR family protein [Reichenbachiella agarivorans]